MRPLPPVTASVLALFAAFAGCERADGTATADGSSASAGAAGDGDVYGDGDGDGDGDRPVGDGDMPDGAGGFPPVIVGGGSPGMGGGPAGPIDYSDRVYTLEGCEAETQSDGMGGAGSCEGVTFTVWDAHTDKSPQSCRLVSDEVTITITGDAPLTVSADFCRDNILSAAFTYDGIEQGVHGVSPFALSPDTDGNFDEADPALTPGVYELVANGYGLTGAMGDPIESGTITVIVVDADASTGGAGGASN